MDVSVTREDQDVTCLTVRQSAWRRSKNLPLRRQHCHKTKKLQMPSEGWITLIFWYQVQAGIGGGGAEVGVWDPCSTRTRQQLIDTVMFILLVNTNKPIRPVPLSVLSSGWFSAYHLLSDSAFLQVFTTLIITLLFWGHGGCHVWN